MFPYYSDHACSVVSTSYLNNKNCLQIYDHIESINGHQVYVYLKDWSFDYETKVYLNL